MKRELARSLFVAGATLGVWVALQVFAIAIVCLPHRAYEQRLVDPLSVIVERGERIAGPGQATFACETPHVTGPVNWHQDLDCYCAPATMTPREVSDRVGGVCAVDSLSPSTDTPFGSCRFARCNHEVTF